MSDLFASPAAFVQEMLLKLPALLIAVTVHELAHGIVADRLGDPTARLAGRLTLNPLPHIDLVGALTFVLVGFGWAKPVPVDARNLRHPARDMTRIAAAGPGANLAVAFLALVALVMLARATGWSYGPPLVAMLLAVYQFNLALAIFNLIPLPPLDGGHFLPYFLPRRAGPLLHRLERYGPLLLLLLVITGATRYIVGPVFGLISGIYVTVVRAVL
jgi:Zn-dependent protease